MKLQFSVAAILLGFFAACHGPPDSELPAQVESLAALVNHRRDRGSCKVIATAEPIGATTLRFTIHNRMPAPWSVFPGHLPWNGASILAVAEHGGPLDRLYPIADYFGPNTVVPPDATLSGDFDLASVFPDLADAAKWDRVHVLWLYDPDPEFIDCLSAGSAQLGK